MRYSNRFFLYAPFVILLVVAAGSMLRWRSMANDLEAKLLAANRGHEIAPGVTLHFASEAIGGFPFNIDAVLGRAVLAVRSTRGPISLQSDRFAIHALTFGRAQQILEAAGTQTLSWTDSQGEAHRFSFVPGSLRASAIERDGRLVRFDLDLNEFEAYSLTGTRVQLHLRATPNHDDLDLAISGEGLRVLSATRTPANAELAHIAIDGKITRAAPLSSLLAGAEEWRRAVETWRRAKGALRLDRIRIAWNASQITGDGLFTLDEFHRPSGDLHLSIAGAQRWNPTGLATTRFLIALSDLTKADRVSPVPLAISTDIRNGAATATSAAGTSYPAGTLQPVF